MGMVLCLFAGLRHRNSTELVLLGKEKTKAFTFVRYSNGFILSDRVAVSAGQNPAPCRVFNP
jgi:hypothetical protein